MSLCFKQTMRWFGPEDPASLSDIRQKKTKPLQHHVGAASFYIEEIKKSSIRRKTPEGRLPIKFRCRPLLKRYKKSEFFSELITQLDFCPLRSQIRAQSKPFFQHRHQGIVYPVGGIGAQGPNGCSH